MATLQLLRQENTGVVYTDPAKMDLTVRFRNTSSKKTLNGVPVQNSMSEIIINDGNAVTVGGVAAVDAVSVRLRVSGALESSARITTLIIALASQMSTWNAEKCFQGFRPSTAPVIPAAG